MLLSYFLLIDYFGFSIDPRRKIQMTLPLHSCYDPASFAMGRNHMGPYPGIQANLAAAAQFPETLPHRTQSKSVC